ncbi:MAG: hypothetical protein ACI9CA_001126 [Natronomonas sp.]|jgi:hypothetical protein
MLHNNRSPVRIRADNTGPGNTCSPAGGTSGLSVFDRETTAVNAPPAPGPTLKCGVTVTTTGDRLNAQSVPLYAENERVSDALFGATLAGGESASGGFTVLHPRTGASPTRVCVLITSV